jgi:hypothetical protein
MFVLNLFKRGFIFSLTIFLFGLTFAAQAQKSASVNPDITGRELRNFDRFLDKHPELDEALMRNPDLIRNSTFLANHPALDEFLKKHPGVNEELRETPRYFMRREESWERRHPNHDFVPPKSGRAKRPRQPHLLKTR